MLPTGPPHWGIKHGRICTLEGRHRRARSRGVDERSVRAFWIPQYTHSFAAVRTGRSGTVGGDESAAAGAANADQDVGKAGGRAGDQTAPDTRCDGPPADAARC